jgi:hypothetical protein
MTKRELPLLFMGIGAGFLLWHEHRGNFLLALLFYYSGGLSFEAMTQNLWNYHPEVGKTRFCIPHTDINILLPFGWMFIACGGAFFASYYWQYVLITGALGCAVELTFFNLRCWEYDFDEKFMGLFRPYLPKMTLGGVPLQILVSYFMVIGSVNWFIMERLLP